MFLNFCTSSFSDLLTLQTILLILDSVLLKVFLSSHIPKTGLNISHEFSPGNESSTRKLWCFLDVDFIVWQMIDFSVILIPLSKKTNNGVKKQNEEKK